MYGIKVQITLGVDPLVEIIDTMFLFTRNKIRTYLIFYTILINISINRKILLDVK